MKFFVLALILPFVAGQDCPPVEDVPCDGMLCSGPVDPNGCMMPPMCMPMPTGEEICPMMCPTHCGPNDMMCPGHVDPNGCMMPGMCMPMPSTEDVCPMMCPVMCGPNEITCGGELDPNDCPMPQWCTDMEGIHAVSYTHLTLPTKA